MMNQLMHTMTPFLKWNFNPVQILNFPMMARGNHHTIIPRLLAWSTPSLVYHQFPLLLPAGASAIPAGRLIRNFPSQIQLWDDSDILKLFFIMITGRQQSPKPGQHGLISKQSSTGPLRKTYFRFREVKPVQLPSPPRNASKSSPRHYSDFYSQQQAVLERMKVRDKKMSSTASSFYTGPARNRLSSIDQGDSSTMRRTFFKPESPQSSFGRTSLSFKRQNVFNQEDNNNYLNKYQIVKQLGKGSFSTVFLAKRIQKKPVDRSPSPLKERDLEESPAKVPDVDEQLENKLLMLRKEESLIERSGQNVEEKVDVEKETEPEGAPQEDIQQLVAIKVYEKFKMNKDPHKFKNIRKEVNIMQHLRHESVLKMYESVETLTKISLVVEFAGYESLLEYVKHNYPLTLEKVRDISRQLLDALIYIHDRNIVHRDIKLQNVLIHNDKVKLIDFGFSCLTHKNQKLTVICGTPNYMAPEVISRKEYEGQQADVWSFGVVVYALAEGRHPFKAETYNELERLVNRGKLEFKKTKDQEFMDFVRRLLKVKPSQRPTARQIQQMKWLTSISK